VVVMVEIFAAAAMEAAEGQGFVMAAMEWMVFSLGSSPLYIGSRRPPNEPFGVPYDLREVWEWTWVKSVEKRVRSWGFRRLEPAVRAHGTVRCGHTDAR
jgi:hypothetical protein